MVVKEPILGRLTQGVIFNCAQAERYGEHAAHGLVITARCDFANEKVPVVTYLPIVPLNAWLAVDGLDILVDRAKRDFRGTVSNFCKQNEIAPTILESQSVDAVVEAFFPAGTGKKTGKLREQGKKLAEIDHRFTNLDRGGDVEFLYEFFSSQHKSILRELCAHKLSGYYFLPSIYQDDSSPGYVTLMREITSLPTGVAMAVASGLDAPTSGEQVRGLRFTDQMAMPVAELTSPTLEHLMQSFSLLYGRIGVRDLEKDYVERIVSTEPLRGKP